MFISCPTGARRTEIGNSSPTLYKYGTISTSHLGELQREIDQLKSEGRLSNHPTYQSYMQELSFAIPENLPDARSIIVIAFPMKLLLVRFHLNRRSHEVTFPSNYCKDGLVQEDFQRTVLRKITGDQKCKTERTWSVHLKLVAVRSGMGKYGRNNLCYVDGMGSLLRLVAFFADCELEDNWTEVSMMNSCIECKACINSCPNNCITEKDFVIVAGRCLSLYNEIEGEIPAWISPSAHNSLIGCMKCQSACPANRKVLESAKRLEDITEEETREILKGKPSRELLDSLSRKLGDIYPTRSAESFKILTRNLKALLTSKSILWNKPLLPEHGDS